MGHIAVTLKGVGNDCFAKALVYLKQMEKLESGADVKRLAHHVIEALEDLEGRLKALEKRQAGEDAKSRR